jgi:hypothetical protein
VMFDLSVLVLLLRVVGNGLPFDFSGFMSLVPLCSTVAAVSGRFRVFCSCRTWSKP